MDPCQAGVCAFASLIWASGKELLHFLFSISSTDSFFPSQNIKALNKQLWVVFSVTFMSGQTSRHKYFSGCWSVCLSFGGFAWFEVPLCWYYRNVCAHAKLPLSQLTMCPFLVVWKFRFLQSRATNINPTAGATLATCKWPNVTLCNFLCLMHKAIGGIIACYSLTMCCCWRLHLIGNAISSHWIYQSLW